MAKYLFDLDLEEIPLGWEEAYQEALTRCPDGEIIPPLPDDAFNRPCFYHPVAYRALILKTFNKYKLLARRLMEEQKPDIKSWITELVKVDIILYKLLSLWVSEFMDISCYDPKDFNSDVFGANDSYFSYISDDMQPYEGLKLLNLHVED
ncbi:hypothetical protein CHH78_02290 [Shouchella clausii]|uniref:hypothetical protein n=1 Tax=Shouchella clausii TaxID=79880 RepID=UPI000BA7D46A|nr:hypothetical protein [Shouchella clausii]MCM3312010.1 hypothetical protein [Psychrobacillus sp. MER TA 17]PAD10165.1 hypothetical protein CHH76_05480 [Shouchella clausii]PAE84945.1 hypothetical protein CHH77_02170 [Shouchella clausii]PAE86147.1 hypothetical protein CHH78_02290 [Shouchella clausii]PAF06829.1 hypothetical protein CHH66_02285 [Shouchella clausii]